MYPVSAQFKAALATSGTWQSTVSASYNGHQTMADVPFHDGAVTVDRGSKVRRSLSLSVSDPALLPFGATDTLGAAGQIAQVQSGPRYTDGQSELVPLGFFTLDTPSGDPDFGPVTLTGSSAELFLQDDIFVSPVTTAGHAATCVAAMTYLLQQTLPTATIDNRTGRDPSCPTRTWDSGGDRWDAIVEIATSMTAEIYVDAVGTFVLRNPPDPLTDPVVWEIAAGDLLIDDTRGQTRSGVCNQIIVTGENTSDGTAPVTGSARLTDPTDPLRWGGPFGRKTRIVSSPLVTTLAQANTMAQSLLRQYTAPHMTASISTVPNPALEAGDVIRIVHTGGRAELAVVQSLTIPLTVDGSATITLWDAREDTGG